MEEISDVAEALSTQGLRAKVNSERDAMQKDAKRKRMRTGLGDTPCVAAMLALICMGACAAAPSAGAQAGQREANRMTFGPTNPFYKASTLPFEAPPFDKIKDSDYQPAIEAGMAEQRKEFAAIANDAAEPTFENTLVALEKSGLLLNRVMGAFNLVSQASITPEITRVKQIEAPKLASQQDAMFLDAKLFARVAAVYKQRDALKLDPESMKLTEWYYKKFVHAGANLSDEDKSKLKKLNEEESTLASDFSTKLVAAAKEAAFFTTDQSVLSGLSEAQMQAATEDAKQAKREGFMIPLQNTTQQPDFTVLRSRETRHAIFEKGWTRAERGGANDTRATITRLAKVRAEKAKLLGYANFAAWTLEDQMAKTPDAAVKFIDALVPGATAKATGEGKEIQALIDGQKGGFEVQPWDWEFYAEQIRRSKYQLDENETKPYFELNRVLENGVFYAANQLYGLTFKERKDIPVYEPDARVFEVFEADGKPLALFYCDYFKRDNKWGGAWMDQFVMGSKLLKELPVVYNVANFAKPAPGQPALLTFDDVTTMFHEFGHALHGMFGVTEYPSLSGTSVARDFVEFPSQFNEHWASEPAVFKNYAKHYKTGAAMPDELAAKILKPATFDEGYALTELLAAASIDMQWHTLPADAPLQNADTFDTMALTKTHVALPAVPPRYRSSYFLHIWSNGYAAGYYAYLWSEMLDDDAFQWFKDHGGMTRANGNRLRQMVLSRGNTEDLATMYRAWLGKDPEIGPMLKERGLK